MIFLKAFMLMMAAMLGVFIYITCLCELSVSVSKKMDHDLHVAIMVTGICVLTSGIVAGLVCYVGK